MKGQAQVVAMAGAHREMCEPMTTRYAVYYAPEDDSPLARFAREWLGRDACTGNTHPQPALSDIPAEALQAMVAPAARYGFHGTLKAPFYLSSEDREGALIQALETFAAQESAFRLPKLVLRSMGAFLALVPETPYEALNALAQRAVRHFDTYRRPASTQEKQRRLAKGLSQRQIELLDKWGYPYVMDEFRFHLTLTGPIKDAQLRSRVIQALERRLANLDLDGVAIASVCLFTQAGVDRPFNCQKRFAFGGQ